VPLSNNANPMHPRGTSTSLRGLWPERRPACDQWPRVAPLTLWQTGGTTRSSTSTTISAPRAIEPRGSLNRAGARRHLIRRPTPFGRRRDIIPPGKNFTGDRRVNLWQHHEQGLSTSTPNLVYGKSHQHRQPTFGAFYSSRKPIVINRDRSYSQFPPACLRSTPTRQAAGDPGRVLHSLGPLVGLAHHHRMRHPRNDDQLFFASRVRPRTPVSTADPDHRQPQPYHGLVSGQPVHLHPPSAAPTFLQTNSPAPIPRSNRQGMFTAWNLATSSVEREGYGDMAFYNRTPPDAELRPMHRPLDSPAILPSVIPPRTANPILTSPRKSPFGGPAPVPAPPGVQLGSNPFNQDIAGSSRMRPRRVRAIAYSKTRNTLCPSPPAQVRQRRASFHQSTTGQAR